MIMHDPSVIKSLYGSRNAHKLQRGGFAESAKRSIESAEKIRKKKQSPNTAGRCCNRTKRWCLPLTKPFTIVFISLSFAVHWRILQTIMSRLERRKFNVPFSVVFSLGLYCCQVVHRRMSASFYFKTLFAPKRILRSLSLMLPFLCWFRAMRRARKVVA